VILRPLAVSFGILGTDGERDSPPTGVAPDRGRAGRFDAHRRVPRVIGDASTVWRGDSAPARIDSQRNACRVE
jgi:hypothetical protein